MFIASSAAGVLAPDFGVSYKWAPCTHNPPRPRAILTSPLCHEGVDIHQGREQLERHLEPGLLPERIDDWVSDALAGVSDTLVCSHVYFKARRGRKGLLHKQATNL